MEECGRIQYFISVAPIFGLIILRDLPFKSFLSKKNENRPCVILKIYLFLVLETWLLYKMFFMEVIHIHEWRSDAEAWKLKII